MEAKSKCAPALTVGVAALMLSACASERASVEYFPPTAICLDGTHSHSPRREGTCANHDGVARWMEISHRGRRGD